MLYKKSLQIIYSLISKAPYMIPKLLLIFFTWSSNINEVTKTILKFFIQKFQNHEKAQNATIEQK